jgi:hypothetical protein
MLTCKEVVKIVSSDDRVSWRKRLEVRMHLFICHYCGKYVKQLEHMSAGFRRLFQTRTNGDHSEEIKRIESEVLKKVK